MITLNVNGSQRELDIPPETPLLWALRDALGLVGTKFGCGAALCGACTVHVDGVPTRSCVFPIANAAGKAVVTIEGIADVAATANVTKAVIDAWIAAAVPQCGYCQPGFVMATIGAIAATPRPTRDGVLDQLSNICRCGTYDAVRWAVAEALETLKRAP